MPTSAAAARREPRQLREARSLRLDDVAAVLGVAPRRVSCVETGKAPTRTGYLTMMLDHYRVDDADERRRLADLARQGQRQGWWADYRDVLPAGAGTWLGLEHAAVRVLSFSVRPSLPCSPPPHIRQRRARRPGPAWRGPS